jgi:uncharacterized YccA/Bax inhibitor family protein
MESSNPLFKREQAFSNAYAQSEVMTLDGVTYKSGILLLLCMGTGVLSWMNPSLALPFIIIGILGGFIACMVGMFIPKASPFAAPLYAVLEGLALGAISRFFEVKYGGIVGNAVLLTFGVMGLMLVLYITRTIKVTGKLVAGVIIATLAIAGVYLVDMIMNLFGANVPFLHSNGWIGIGISLLIVGVAAFNLLLDFSLIESSVAQKQPRYMEWYCSMALLVTLVWLYIEILRLLSKLRGRD